MPKLDSPGSGAPGHNHNHPQGRHSSRSSNIDMEKVKIKRVKRNKKKITTKEKVVASLGVGTTLLGGVSAVIPKTEGTQFVSTQNQQQSAGTSKIKATLDKIFGGIYQNTIGPKQAKAEAFFAGSSDPGASNAGNSGGGGDEGDGGDAASDDTASDDTASDSSVTTDNNQQTTDDSTSSANSNNSTAPAAADDSNQQQDVLAQPPANAATPTTTDTNLATAPGLFTQQQLAAADAANAAATEANTEANVAAQAQFNVDNDQYFNQTVSAANSQAPTNPNQAVAQVAPSSVTVRLSNGVTESISVSWDTSGTTGTGSDSYGNSFEFNFDPGSGSVSASQSSGPSVVSVVVVSQQSGGSSSSLGDGFGSGDDGEDAYNNTVSQAFNQANPNSSNNIQVSQPVGSSSADTPTSYQIVGYADNGSTPVYSYNGQLIDESGNNYQLQADGTYATTTSNSINNQSINTPPVQQTPPVTVVAATSPTVTAATQSGNEGADGQADAYTENGIPLYYNNNGVLEDSEGNTYVDPGGPSTPILVSASSGAATNTSPTSPLDATSGTLNSGTISQPSLTLANSNESSVFGSGSNAPSSVLDSTSGTLTAADSSDAPLNTGDSYQETDYTDSQGHEVYSLSANGIQQYYFQAPANLNGGGSATANGFVPASPVFTDGEITDFTGYPQTSASSVSIPASSVTGNSIATATQFTPVGTPQIVYPGNYPLPNGQSVDISVTSQPGIYGISTNNLNGSVNSTTGTASQVLALIGNNTSASIVTNNQIVASTVTGVPLSYNNAGQLTDSQGNVYEYQGGAYPVMVSSNAVNSGSDSNTGKLVYTITANGQNYTFSPALGSQILNSSGTALSTDQTQALFATIAAAQQSGTLLGNSATQNLAPTFGDSYSAALAAVQTQPPTVVTPSQSPVTISSAVENPGQNPGGAFDDNSNPLGNNISPLENSSVLATGVVAADSVNPVSSAAPASSPAVQSSAAATVPVQAAAPDNAPALPYGNTKALNADQLSQETTSVPDATVAPASQPAGLPSNIQNTINNNHPAQVSITSTSNSPDGLSDSYTPVDGTNYFLGNDNNYYTKNSDGSYSQVSQPTVAASLLATDGITDSSPDPQTPSALSSAAGKVVGAADQVGQGISNDANALAGKVKGLLGGGSSTGDSSGDFGSGTGYFSDTYSGKAVTNSDNGVVATITDTSKNTASLYNYYSDGTSNGVYSDSSSDSNNGNIYVQSGKGQYTYTGVTVGQLDPSAVSATSATNMVGLDGSKLTQVGDGTYKDSLNNLYTLSQAGLPILSGLQVVTDTQGNTVTDSDGYAQVQAAANAGGVLDYQQNLEKTVDTTMQAISSKTGLTVTLGTDNQIHISSNDGESGIVMSQQAFTSQVISVDSSVLGKGLKVFSNLIPLSALTGGGAGQTGSSAAAFDPTQPTILYNQKTGATVIIDSGGISFVDPNGNTIDYFTQAQMKQILQGGAVGGMNISNLSQWIPQQSSSKALNALNKLGGAVVGTNPSQQVISTWAGVPTAPKSGSKNPFTSKNP